MFEHRISGFSQPVTIIHPGEYLATDDDIIIATVLGSCVAVALKDEVRGVGGLNHFMLPGALDAHEGPKGLYSTHAKYGIYAMELLINDMMKMGCRKDRMVAKVFGGGSVLGRARGEMGKVPKSNVDFALQFLRTEGIPVLSSDLGGHQARKVLFFVKEGKVLLKRITGTLVVAVEKEESTYFERIKAKEPEAGEITLFGD